MGNSPTKNQAEAFLAKLIKEPIQESDHTFWKGLFQTLSPTLQIPDLTGLFVSQKSNVEIISSKAVEYLESLWLQVGDWDDGLVVAAENSLNFLSALVPVSHEQRYLELFWSSDMKAYRSVKAACNLYSAINFGSSTHYGTNLTNTNFMQIIESSSDCIRRRELILKFLLSCISLTSSSWRSLIIQEIIPCEHFIYSILNSFLVDNSPNLIKKALKFISIIISSPIPSISTELDLFFIQLLLKERRNPGTNIIAQMFKNFSDESVNKVLYCTVKAARSLENTFGIYDLLGFVATIYRENLTFCKYTAISQHFSLVSSILMNKALVTNRNSIPFFSKVFYMLSKHREFCVSLSVVESNSLTQALCQIVQIPMHEYKGYFPILLGTFCNISAFLLDVYHDTALEITKTFEYVIDRNYLLAEETNHHNVFYIVEGITNIIQYQWESAPFLMYYIIKKKESFFKIIRMQVNTADEPALDDKATEGELSENSIGGFEDEENAHNITPENEQDIVCGKGSENTPSEDSHSDNPEEEKKIESFGMTPRESEEINSEEEDDRVIELERISEGLILGLAAGLPEEVVQRTSYLNTHVSTFSEDIDRRNTVQHIESLHIKDEEWKPTPEWMLIWKNKLPMKCIYITIKELFSHIIEMQESKKKIEEIIDFIRNSTLVGVLPRPHPIYTVLNLSIDVN